MAATIETIFKRLNERRQDLGMSCAALAKATGLSLRTVQRVLSGEEKDPGFRTVSALAEALGASLRLQAEADLNTLRRDQAERKAERIVALVKGTSALEGQAVDGETEKALRERTVRDLLAGSNRKLWAE
jgi:transcriptional regulator with XRE-family HTH domain